MMSRGVALSGNASDNSIWNYDSGEDQKPRRRRRHFNWLSSCSKASSALWWVSLPPSSFHFPLPFLFFYFRLAQLVVCAIPYEKKSCRLCSTLAKDAISIYYGARQLLAIIYGMCIASLATSNSSFYCWLHNAHIIFDVSHIKHVSSLSPSLFLYSDSTGFVSSWSSVIQDIW